MKNTRCLFNESQTPEGMISVSQLQTFLACKKKWEYNYIENIAPRVERSYLTIGKLCHKGMQVVMQMLWEQKNLSLVQLTAAGVAAMRGNFDEYIGTTPLLDEEFPEIEQMWEDAVSVFTQAIKEFNPLKYEVVTVYKDRKPIPALELHFKVPCPPTKGMHGYIDAILKDKDTGYIWCTDYKFRKSLAPDDDEAYNIQNSVYLYVCRMMGIDVTGTMTWQHVNTPASDPQLLKTGAVSRAKIKTTWDHYEQFCLDHGEDPENYREEMYEKLADIEWWRATQEYRNDLTVANIWNECVIPAAKQIKSARNPKAVNFRSLYPWNCKLCQYQSLCQAELRGYDADAIRQREYTCRNFSDMSGTHEKVSSLASDAQDE